MNANNRELRPRHDRSDRVRSPGSSDLQARYARTLTLARGAEMSGDKVEAERLYQQADHYRRLLNQAA